MTPTDAFYMPSGASKVVYAGEKGKAYRRYDGTLPTEPTDLYLSTLDLADEKLDALAEYVLDKSVNVVVAAGRTLEEVGRMDARFRRSPVMLMHECGLLGQCAVVGGIYLDHDDLALLAQEGVPLILTPTSDAGRGNGIPPVMAAVQAGTKLYLGSDDGAYNPTRDIYYEARVLRLLVSAQMNVRDAIDPYVLARMCVPNAPASALERIIETILRYEE